MKLATYQDGSRDGQLVVVSRDLRHAHYASGIATRLQQVLDDWGFLAPQLEDLSRQLNQGRARHAFDFDPAQCLAPLPRAGQWVQVLADDPAAAPGALPTLLWGPGDALDGPRAERVLGRADDRLLVGPQWVAVTGDVPVGASPAEALDGVRLLMLACDWRLAPAGEAGAPLPLATAFGPVAVTPDEAGSAWSAGQLAGTLALQRGGRPAARWDGAAGLRLHLGQRMAWLARHRALGAGSLVGTGPLAGLADEAEPLQWGDALRLDFRTPDGASLFGTVEQTVVERG